jgi:signal transduction histidine kinase/ligand-binding sensor domain-containing protein
MAFRRPLLLRFNWPRTMAGSAAVSCLTLVLLLASAVPLLASRLIAPAHAQSQPPQYVTEVWHTEQGLPQNSVNAMLQDHRGYLWIGTFGGLARFDGERFTVFDSANTPGFGSDQIFSLYESHSGALWVGTVDGGLIRLQDGVATTYTERDGLPNRWVTSIRGDVEGKLWINTAGGGVAHFAGTKLEAYPTHRGKAVREFFLQARDGSMWFRCGQDVVRFAADGSVATLHSTKPSVFLVHEAPDGSVWIAFRDQYRLVRYYQGAFSEVPLPSLGRRKLTTELLLYSFAMTEDADKELLLRTPAGLVRTVNGMVTPPEALPLPANAGELLKVRSLLVDREGNLWVGTVGRGLIRLRRAPLTAYGKDEGLSDSNFSSVFQDREGRIWLGGDLLYWFDGHRFHRVPRMGDILTIAQTRDGDLWFGGYGGGLYRLRSGVLSRFNVNAPAVKIIFQDREGTLWIGALTEDRPGGLYRFRDGKLEQVPGISDVRAIAEDRDGGLWLGGLAGLRYMRGSKIVTYDQKQGLSSNSVYDIHQDSTGTLWVATYGGGLNGFRNGRFKAITTKDGLPDNLLLGLLEDGEGNLWFSSNQSVFRLSLKELNDFADGKISFLSPVSYGAAEGMRSTESNGGRPGGWETSDGRIWFPTLRGVAAINPTAGNRLPPPVVLEEAWANEFTLARNGRTSVPPGNNTLDFRFTALSFSAPEKLRFKYRLEPFDKDWVDARTRRTAHYTNMEPGEYSFHVLAVNNYGIWSGREASVRFVLLPHFYQTNWFRALCAASMLILLWCVYRFRVRQLAYQFNMRLEERVSERTRIARDLHDTLLQSFQGLVFRFQAARYQLPDRPEEASDALDSALISADQAIAEGRSAIQELRSGSSQESNLEQMLLATGHELASSQKDGDSAPSLRVIVEGNRRAERAMISEEVYRIARELLRNAYRHGHARNIEAELRYDDDAFLLIVRDDGKGIDPKVLKDRGRAGHWGLPGMYERAEGIGARLDIWSEVGAGTEVRLTVPAAIAYEKSGDGGRFKLFGKTRIYEHWR